MSSASTKNEDLLMKNIILRLESFLAEPIFHPAFKPIDRPIWILG